MCGINGLSGLWPPNEAEGIIRKMNDALAHRGPDAEGSFVSEGIALGHRRLSIIDLRPEANQPMSDHSGRYTLVFNGEIYNFRELRQRFSNMVWRTEGDTEVLLQGLIAEGGDFLKKCNGMFSFAFWDKNQQRLLLGRDRMGIKPLYYARIGEKLIFSSEIRAILESGLVERNLNFDVIGDYLRYQTVHGEQTIVAGIYSLPSGYLLEVIDHEISLSPYYQMISSFRWPSANWDYVEIKNQVLQKLQQAVSLRMVADVPLGVFLSGGIDSSIMVALAAKASVAPVHTFTVDYGGDGQSEAPFAQEIANLYSTSHQTVTLEPRALIDQLPQALAAMDHPSGDGINTYVVSKAAKDAGITVVLSGLGGDELFAGYPIFSQFNALKSKGWLLSFPKFIRVMAGVGLKAYRPGTASHKTASVLSLDYFDLEQVYPFSREVSSLKANALLSPHASRGARNVQRQIAELVAFGAPGYNMPRLSKVSMAEWITYLQSILLRDADQMSMAHALEVRVPFMDHELWELVLGLGDEYKLSAHAKPLLVDAVGELLPASISRRKKMGFTFPWDKWMRGELRDFCGDHIRRLGHRSGFNAPALSKLWDDFLQGRPTAHWSRIWYLCTLDAWLEINEFD